MNLVKFALYKLNIAPKVTVDFKNIKHKAEVRRVKNGYKLILSTKYPIHPKVIFHECAHIWQFETKGLVYSDDYKEYDGVAHTGEDYWWYPWEIEARGLEEAIYQSWLNKEKDWKCTAKKMRKSLKATQASQSTNSPES